MAEQMELLQVAGESKSPPRRAGTAAAALAVTLGLAAIAWFVAVWQMSGMAMGVATRLGSFAFFIAVWVAMMAAMMLPAAAPAVVRRAQVKGLRSVLVFPVAYLAVWAVVGIAVYAGYRPHGPLVAGAIVIAVLALAQKLLPAKSAIDVPVAAAIAGLGILIVLAPSVVPGLTPPM